MSEREDLNAPDFILLLRRERKEGDGLEGEKRVSVPSRV